MGQSDSEPNLMAFAPLSHRRATPLRPRRAASFGHTLHGAELETASANVPGPLTLDRDPRECIDMFLYRPSISPAPFVFGVLMLLNATGCDQVWSEWKKEIEERPEIGQSVPDQDQDQLPDAFDCDPQDPKVNREALRPCELDGDQIGQERCVFGVWSACTELPAQDCQEGEEQERGCERCGVQTQVCVEGKWVDQGECRDQKTCNPGETQRNFSGAAMSCGSALQVTSTCNEQCEFDSTEIVAFAGCREDQCCDGMNCDSAPFRTGCTPMPERMETIARDNEIVYPE